MFRSDQPLVEVSSLNAKNHGYVVLVNHAPTTQHVVITSNMAIHSMERIQSGEHTVVPLKQSSWAVDLDPYEGAIFSWK